jgi:hypothetical protein
MAGEEEGSSRFNTVVGISLVLTLILVIVLPMIFSLGKATSYSAYAAADGNDMSQLTEMHDSLGSGGEGYTVANTMSTPMLVNDWKEPHRTLLLIVGPEKPIDETEAQAIFDFVTKKGGKVVVAADNTNANRLAKKFGVTYFDDPMHDEDQHWYQYDEDGNPLSSNWQNVWSVASVVHGVDEMSEGATRTACDQNALRVYGSAIEKCRMPVMFRAPTGMKYEEVETDDPTNKNYIPRDVNPIALASRSAFIDLVGDGDSTNPENPQPGDLSLMIRIDYPNVSALDTLREAGEDGDKYGRLSVTGSIVFVADEEVFANVYWDLARAKEAGLEEECLLESQACWMHKINGYNQWQGNSAYFEALFWSMMELDNSELSTSIKNTRSEFQVVFDESRHVTGVAAAPFIDVMSTIVLLTSDAFLKWLIILNLLLLLLVAIMIVPEKSNWRHVFDLTRFRERPNKVDPSTYRTRVQQALFTKVRVFFDLTRDQMAEKSPAEVQTMIHDPRLVELAYSANRTYSPEELRGLLQAIRRWGKSK